MMLTWEIDEAAGKYLFWEFELKEGVLSSFYLNFLAERAFAYLTDSGKKKMDYHLFQEFMKQFYTNEEPNHPVNMGLEL